VRVPESSNAENAQFPCSSILVQVIFPGATCLAQTQPEKSPYPAMAPLDRYLAPDENSEVALARSAAPASISDAAEVMVLRRDGYATAVKGTNGFLCIVERSWGAATDNPNFWNPKVRGPICFNPPAARTFAPIFLMKTKLVLAGKSKAEIVRATASALDKKELPALEPGAMCYMLSKQQYLSDSGMNWHPHLMFFVAGNAGKAGEPICRARRLWRRTTLKNGQLFSWSGSANGPMGQRIRRLCTDLGLLKSRDLP
jgi:hypothetical protein